MLTSRSCLSQFLRDYFHAQGDEKGLSKETLHNPKYNELMSIRMHYDWSTCVFLELLQSQPDSR